MKDETYAFISDVKDKKITARSARNGRKHCGKGGRVRLPSDNLSKKELRKMNGECKSYRLNDPMNKTEFKSMPDDLKITYIELIRNKYGTPDCALGEALGLSQQGFAKITKKLGLSKGKGKRPTKWDKEGFYAWWNGVDKLSVPVTEEVDEEPVLEEQEIFVEDDLPVEESDSVMDELNLEIGFLRSEVDTLRNVNEELVAVHEKDRAEIAWMRNECDSLRMNARILEAQMEVVRMIFGGINRGCKEGVMYER